MKINQIAIMCMPIIVGACEGHDIKDSVVSDRVKACSAGFSDDLRASLHASLEKATGGEITADIKEETQALIFQETPIDQHLQVYEDYIKCVESNWNVPTSVKLSEDPWDPRHK